MSTFNAFYVRKQASDDATRAEMLSLYPEVQIQVFPEFIGGILSRDVIEPPEQRLARLSAKLDTDVIWVTYQTTVDAVIYHHWRTGEQLRALWYGCATEVGTEQRGNPSRGRRRSSGMRMHLRTGLSAPKTPLSDGSYSSFGRRKSFAKGRPSRASAAATRLFRQLWNTTDWSALSLFFQPSALPRKWPARSEKESGAVF